MPFDAATRAEASDDLAQKREIVRRIDGVIRGRVNWVGEVTLVEDALGTTVEDDRINENSQVSLTPLNFEAASVAGRCFVSAVRPGTLWTPNRIGEFLIVHPAPSNANCKFRFSVMG
jgi:hypothetical protein